MRVHSNSRSALSTADAVPSSGPDRRRHCPDGCGRSADDPGMCLSVRARLQAAHPDAAPAAMSTSRLRSPARPALVGDRTESPHRRASHRPLPDPPPVPRRGWNGRHDQLISSCAAACGHRLGRSRPNSPRDSRNHLTPITGRATMAPDLVAISRRGLGHGGDRGVWGQPWWCRDRTWARWVLAGVVLTVAAKPPAPRTASIRHSKVEYKFLHRNQRRRRESAVPYPSSEGAAR